MKLAFLHVQVLWVVVQLNLVFVMNPLAFTKSSSKKLLSFKAMFVRITSYICEVMVHSDADKHVSVRGDTSSAFPHPIFWTYVPSRHYRLQRLPGFLFLLDPPPFFWLPRIATAPSASIGSIMPESPNMPALACWGCPGAPAD